MVKKVLIVDGSKMVAEQSNPLKILSHIINDQKLDDFLKENASPITVEVNPTNLCNHKCSFCYFKSYRENVCESIPQDVLFDLINDLKGEVKGVIFSGGGEPTLYPDFNNVLYVTKSNMLECGLITNGSKLNTLYESIAETCSWVRVSLDAVVAEEHEMVHGTKDFSKILESIKSLVRIKGDNLVVGASFTYESGADLSKINALKDELMLDYVVVRGLRESKPKSYERCLVHNFIGVVGADSKVYPCCSYFGNDDFCFGSLKDSSFWDIWNSKRRQEVINSIDVSKCPACRYDSYNEILEYIVGSKKHKNFL